MRIPWRVAQAAGDLADFRRDPWPRVNRLTILQPRRWNPSVSFWPAFDSEAEFLDAYGKACYCLPPGSVKRVVFHLGFEPGFPLDRPSEWPRPEYFEEGALQPRNDMAIIRGRKTGIWRAWLTSDLVGIWNLPAAEGIHGLIANSPKLCRMDRRRQDDEGWVWARQMWERMSSDAQARVNREGLQRYRRYLATIGQYEKCYVFGTGPSLDQAWDHDFSDGYRIVCNTIVNNPALLDHLQPHFIAAADAVHHFGNNRHALQFQRDLERALVSRKLLFITRDVFYPLLVHHRPALAEACVPAATTGRDIARSLRGQPVFLEMGNVLTSLMLPLASSLADNVYVLGCDGRAPGARQFWQNARTSSYESLRPAMHAAHPGFFAKSEEEFLAYSRMHDENLEAIMQVGEQSGKHYTCLSASHIPSFHRREGSIGRRWGS